MQFPKLRTIAAVIFFAVLTGCANAPKLSQEVPVIVNGAPITRAEVERAAKALIAKSNTAQPVTPEIMKQVTETAVNQLVAAELLYQAASRLEVKDLDRKVSERMAQSRARYPSQAAYEQAQKSVNMTEKEIRIAVGKDIVIDSMIEGVFLPKAVVSDVEIQNFYQDNKERLFRGAGFEEVKGQVAEFLKQAKVRKAVADFVEQLRGKAKIEKV
ncbi:SurA N-terminal domain-containing protein [Geomonas paludis]|uniref:SurA N-terminal domain-containing protein n=1 Tax=Geomonas paludis TaxID=2740185 RepID=A0A6V8MXG8_9BACT|nr:SurA N-terminal domain-containing protein [Geomonas paludis]UPU37133.1 SurA N-terminal domain-containing protein [Geomonas paludis]GFO64770.1 hypothetical protein GMPD_26890 [Geomonas paludis]